MKTRFIIGSFIIAINANAQKADKTIEQGNQLYKQQQYDQAEIQYNNALKLEPANPTAKFNIANTSYRQGKKSEAIKTFDEIGVMEKDVALRSKAWYNKGVVLSSQQRLEESIEAYKNTLRQNPNDGDARDNLQKALLELKKKEPPKKKEEDKKKKKQDPQPQKKQPQPKMSPKEAEQRLKLLEQKEKEVQQRLQKEKAKSGTAQNKDW